MKARENATKKGVRIAINFDFFGMAGAILSSGVSVMFDSKLEGI